MAGRARSTGPEEELINKLRRIEALHARAGSDGERLAAERARVSSDIRFWSSGDTKTGPPDGVLTGPFWGPLDLCFIGGCRFGVVVGGGNLCRFTGGLPQASSSGGVGRRPALSDEEEPPACGRIRPLRRFWRSR